MVGRTCRPVRPESVGRSHPWHTADRGRLPPTHQHRGRSPERVHGGDAAGAGRERSAALPGVPPVALDFQRGDERDDILLPAGGWTHAGRGDRSQDRRGHPVSHRREARPLYQMHLPRPRSRRQTALRAPRPGRHRSGHGSSQGHRRRGASGDHGARSFRCFRGRGSFAAFFTGIFTVVPWSRQNVGTPSTECSKHTPCFST